MYLTLLVDVENEARRVAPAKAIPTPLKVKREAFKARSEACKSPET